MQRNTYILIGVVILIFVAAAGVSYLLFQPAVNNSPNVTNNTTTTVVNQGTTTQQNQNTTSGYISSAQAKSIASNYLNSKSDYKGLGAGTPSLKGSVYYVPMVVTVEGQHSVGTVLGDVLVDAKTGKVLGTETVDITTDKKVRNPP
jgi:cell division protein YceG involved in septum cleavage